MPAERKPSWQKNLVLAIGAVTALAVLAYVAIWALRPGESAPSLQRASFTQLTFQSGVESFPSLSDLVEGLVRS